MVEKTDRKSVVAHIGNLGRYDVAVAPHDLGFKRELVTKIPAGLIPFCATTIESRLVGVCLDRFAYHEIRSYCDCANIHASNTHGCSRTESLRALGSTL